MTETANVTLVSPANANQTREIAALIAALATRATGSYGNVVATAQFVPNSLVQALAVSNWTIKPDSVCFALVGADGTALADFPYYECKRGGRFALPQIKTYREENVPNTLKPYPDGRTTFDAALFADSHVTKVFRRAPSVGPSNPEQVVSGGKVYANLAALLAEKGMTAPSTPAIETKGISAETGKDTAKLLSEIQGTKAESKPAHKAK